MIEPNDYSISTDKNKLDITVIHTFLANSYWAKDIPLDIVKRTIENSLCFGVYHHNKQVGYARVISDYTTFAYLGDVFIIEEHRGKGLSKMLMQYILDYPQLQGLRSFYLRTRDAHGLYTQFGFSPILKPENAMEIKHENFYSQPRP
jgi:GNAT superfamily N-acetyltransferase